MIATIAMTWNICAYPHAATSSPARIGPAASPTYGADHERYTPAKDVGPRAGGQFHDNTRYG